MAKISERPPAEMPGGDDTMIIVQDGEVRRIDYMALVAAMSTLVGAATQFAATSSTEVTIGLGAKTLGIQSGKLFGVGHPVVVSSESAPENSMQGRVTAHDPLTGTFTFDAEVAEGAGAHDDWAINLVPTLNGQAIYAVIADILAGVLAGYSPVAHGHVIANVAGLQTALDAKLDAAGVSTFAASLLDDTNASNMRTTLGLGTAATSASTAFAAASHVHTIANVTGLQSALDGKQPAGNYAPAAHGHVIGDVAGLQAALDGKQAAGNYATAGHGHVIADVAGLQSALNAKFDAAGISAFASTLLDDTTASAARTTLGLGTAATSAATAFAAASHVHTIANVTGLQAAIDAKMNAANPTMTGTMTLPPYDIVDGAAVALDPTNGADQFWTLGANRNATLHANFSSGRDMAVQVTFGAYSLGITGVTWETPGGTPPAPPASGVGTIYLKNCKGTVRAWKLWAA